MRTILRYIKDTLKRRVVRFIVAGGVAAFLEYVSFLLIMVIKLPLGGYLLIFGQIASYMLGFIVSFWLQKKWVFGGGGSIRGDLLKYSLLAVMNIVLSVVAIWLLVNVVGVGSYISKFLVMAMVAIWNYFIFSKIIFKPSEG